MKLKQVISNLWFIINWFMRQLIFFSPRARFAFKAGPPYYKGTLIFNLGQSIKTSSDFHKFFRDKKKHATKLKILSPKKATFKQW